MDVSHQALQLTGSRPTPVAHWIMDAVDADRVAVWHGAKRLCRGKIRPGRLVERSGHPIHAIFETPSEGWNGQAAEWTGFH